jgi:hypothetical protein
MRSLLLIAVATACVAAVVPAASAAATSFAVIGDVPYTRAQAAAFPSLVASINADPDVVFAAHVGDIKSGTTPCQDETYAAVRLLFDSFTKPLLYTPGDNEWADCDGPEAGAYLPTERLRFLRGAFFSPPGMTLGASRPVVTQGQVSRFRRMVENQRLRAAGVVVGTLHVVGSGNGLTPWFGGAETAQQQAKRLRENRRRTAADLQWMHRIFRRADRFDARGVVLLMHADMWSPRAITPGPWLDAYTPIVQALAELAAAYQRPVLLIQGDSHRFQADQPLAFGSPAHGVAVAVPNLTRIVVEGETVNEWLRVTIADTGQEPVFSWQRVPLTSRRAPAP